MDIEANWKKLNHRMRSENPGALPELADIHLDALNELTDSGNLLAINGETAARLAAKKNLSGKFALAGELGRYLIDFKPEGGMFSYTMNIKMPDSFPSCIAIAAAALLENFCGVLPSTLRLCCRYSTDVNRGDPLGKLLTKLIADCFPFAELSFDVSSYGKSSGKNKIISKLFG